MEVPIGGVDDMTRLSYLHEPGVLHNLSSRYYMNKIYTYTGNILIAVNPFQRFPGLYDVNMMQKYKGASFGSLNPHIFAIADAAYWAMINEGKSNSILVSGESGAGKTETTKLLMQYLAYLGGHASSEKRTVEQKVLESNPVLEAFGNAKTVRNNNSSRFGKFVEIQFDKHGRISGAAIRTYLLERSRVCQISDPERNYHCFYHLCSAPQDVIEKYKLGYPKSFHYLNQSNCYEIVGVSDTDDYLATRRAMDVVGIREQEQDSIFRVIAAILHLGNIDFCKGKEIDSSVLKGDESKFHLKMTAELLMCDPQALENALCRRVMVTREEVITRTLDPHGARVSRDALAKTIYSRLFDWLVNTINNSIGQDSNSKTLIGILDIYGFESFNTNSFEQFCINFTNEKLQQHFNQNVFKMAQEEYAKEEIHWSYIEFVDNQDVLDLIEKNPSMELDMTLNGRSYKDLWLESVAENTKLNEILSLHGIQLVEEISQQSARIIQLEVEVTSLKGFIKDMKSFTLLQKEDRFKVSNVDPLINNMEQATGMTNEDVEDFQGIHEKIISRLKKQEAHIATLRAAIPIGIPIPGLATLAEPVPRLRDLIAANMTKEELAIEHIQMFLRVQYLEQMVASLREVQAFAVKWMDALQQEASQFRSLAAASLQDFF